MTDVELLEHVPLLAVLPDEILLRLAAESEGIAVKAGNWLFREGEQADSLFVVRSGRLEVVQEGPPEVLLRILGRGEVLGELALLRGEARSASVRARRDSRLLEVGREQFEELISSVPGFALGLSRAIGERLVAEAGVHARSPRTISLVCLEDVSLARDAATALVAELAGCLPVVELDRTCARTETEMAAALDRAERDADLVLLLALEGSGESAWTEFCLRESDLVVAFSHGRPAPGWLQRPAHLGGSELVVIGAVDGRRLGGLRPRELQIVRDPASIGARMEATARRLTARSVGVVLSGGGARAFAHIGVLEELRAGGVQIERIGGVGIGAIVAAASAVGIHGDDLHALFRRSFVETSPSRDFTLPAYSLARGSRVRALLAETFGSLLIEELPVRFFCVSCDLVSREPIVHRRGPLAEAVYASLATPGVFPPVHTGDGRLLVDGGVLDNLPVAAMAMRGEGPVIAVDVTGRVGGPEISASRLGLSQPGRLLRRYLTGSEAALPHLGETLARALAAASEGSVAVGRRQADLLISPDVDGVGVTDWRALSRARELGRRAARLTLAAAPGDPLG